MITMVKATENMEANRSKQIEMLVLHINKQLRMLCGKDEAVYLQGSGEYSNVSHSILMEVAAIFQAEGYKTLIFGRGMFMEYERAYTLRVGFPISTTIEGLER